MKKKRTVLKIILIVTILFALVILALLIAYAAILAKNPNPDRPLSIENKTGFVKAYGRNIYDESGDLLTLKGINLGNWFIQESWMSVSNVEGYETGVHTEVRGREAMKANPNLSDEQIEELCQMYVDAYITEKDFEIIASSGLNSVRINFSYINLTEEDGTTINNKGFEKLDWALDMCEKYSLYAILDLHGALGSQNKDMHSGDDGRFELYGSEENMAATLSLWEAVAARYCARTVVAAYDLLNEPRSSPGKYAGKQQFDFYDTLYNAVRKIDPYHMIIMECFTFPIHGVSEKEYDWENVCYSYHIYNRTSVSQKTCLDFYKVLHNIMDYGVPIYIGEWNAWNNPDDWNMTMDYFDNLDWSYSSWTYKANSYYYKNYSNKNNKNWGMFELDIKPVNVYTATYDEISAVWSSTVTENAERTFIYDVYSKRFN